MKSPKSVSCDAMTNVGSCLMRTANVDESRIVEIVDNVSLKFASDEDAG